MNPLSVTLLPCPFCGTVPEQPACYQNHTSGKWGLVQCTNCGAQSGDVRAGYDPVSEWAADAAAEWNTRNTPVNPLSNVGGNRRL